MSNIYFANKLKEIRKNQSLTQIDVASQAFMSRRKLIDIENGNIAPSIEDIMSLSNVYKQDLIKLFMDYKQFHNTDIKKEIDEIEFKLSDMDYNSLTTNLDKLAEYQDHNSFLKQYYYAILGFYYMNSNKMNIDIAIDHLLTALKINNENFEISHYKDFKYSSLELRILIAWADCIRFNGNPTLYYEVCEFCYNQLSEINTSYFVVTIQYATIKTMQEKFQESINIVDNCIMKANQVNNHIYLPFLYYLNYLNYRFLNKFTESEECLDKSISLSDCYNKTNLKKLIIKRVHKIKTDNL